MEACNCQIQIQYANKFNSIQFKREGVDGKGGRTLPACLTSRLYLIYNLSWGENTTTSSRHQCGLI